MIHLVASKNDVIGAAGKTSARLSATPCRTNVTGHKRRSGVYTHMPKLDHLLIDHTINPSPLHEFMAASDKSYYFASVRIG
jgi:hypothetical protein